jgi:DNA gyrase subunit A
VRDGLKPVHRRVLYAMHDLGLASNKPHKKCARIVGEVLGKYHPHGDMSVYDTMVRMAQDFSLRYMLVAGHGNFGSLDGDNAAAMRYTEARLSAVAEEMLEDIDKETVNFAPNFDETLEEPLLLPAKVPNLLINGSDGIAVGMATKIPPHNLTEIVDGLVKLIENPEITIGELMCYIKGPDFPTGANLVSRSELREIYETGRGRLIIRGEIEVEVDEKKNKTRLIVREIPYQVNKAKLVENIAELVNHKKIEGITDIRDESNREGIRVVIELKRGEDPELVLNQLYTHTQLQTTFGVIMLALVDNRPLILNLKQILEHFIEHRVIIVTRRTQYLLKKAEERAHVLEGLKIALDNIDAVIKTIRGSKTVNEARQTLMSNFSLSQIQSDAILEMKLQKLTSLETEKLKEEYEKLLDMISKYKRILADRKRVLSIIKDELADMKERYGDERRTRFIEWVDEITKEDLVKEEEVVVTITHSGYIKRIPLETYRCQKRGGKGISSNRSLLDEDFVEHCYTASTKDYIFFFTTMGRVISMKVYEIPEASRVAKGKAIMNLIKIETGEKIAAVIPIKAMEDQKFLVMATARGTVKKTSLLEFKYSLSRAIKAITLNEGDELISVAMTDGDQDIVLATKSGKAIRFAESEIRNMGRQAMGVRGIKIRDDDTVVAMVAGKEECTLLTVTEKGYTKRTEVGAYTKHHRGGGGMMNIRITRVNGPVVTVLMVREDEDLVVITVSGMTIRTAVKNIRPTGRAAQGFILIRLKESDRVVGVVSVAREEEENFGTDGNPDANLVAPNTGADGSLKPGGSPKPGGNPGAGGEGEPKSPTNGDSSTS